MSNSYHNPDVLTCLANLSNDEVFTPPHIANQMLDLLLQEIWSNPDAKFLDPCSKSGVFLREIAKRLIEGLETQIPDLGQRVQHILKNQLYGIAITELTALLSRRTLYCTKAANHPKYALADFTTPEGNISFKETAHTWEKGRCIYCGASEGVLGEDARAEKEAHAYAFIHNFTNENPYENMQFDVIIGNPPYQLNDGGGTGDSAKPIYQKFIEQAIRLNPYYLVMIIPSRWMKGGKGLDKFRDTMMNDTRMKTIYDYEIDKECFAELNIDGGVCYFLWDRHHNAEVDYYYKPKGADIIYSKRYLKNEVSSTIVRDYRQYSIIKKVVEKENERFSSIVLSRNPYGLSSDFFNKPENYPNVKQSNKPQDQFLKLYGVKGKKGGAKRVFTYVYNGDYIKNKEYVNKYKLFFSKAYMTTSTVPPEIIIGEPDTICTETFLNIGKFETKRQALNVLSYIKTKFFRALLFFNRHSLNISQSSFELIPLQDFSKPWTDEELYEKYSLTEVEIKYIDELIEPME